MNLKIFASCMAFFSITSFANTLPDPALAKSTFLSVFEKSDSGCLELMSFKINGESSKTSRGIEYYDFEYEATIKSLSTCTLIEVPKFNPKITGFYGAQRNPKNQLPKPSLKRGEEIKVKGHIGFKNTENGWSAE